MSADPPPRQPLQPMRVLVIEDEQRYRAFLIDVLGDMHCQPTGVATALEALRMIGEQKPDAVLLDLNLPRMDGMTFLKRFRERHDDVPVIIITGVGDLKSAQQAIQHGVTEFLTKPCHLGQIERAIDRARRQMQRHNGSTPTEHGEDTNQTPTVRPIAEIEREAILAALQATNGNRSAAAIELGISRRTLYNRLDAYRAQGITIPGS